VLQKDFEKAIDIIGENALIEIDTTKGVDSKDKNTKTATYSSIENIDELDNKVYDIEEFFELSKISENGSLRDIYDIKTYIDSLYEEWESHIKKYRELIATKSDYENQLIEIERFKNLEMSKEELENLTYIHYVAGTISNEDVETLKEELKERAIIKLVADNLYIIFASKKGRWTLESALKKRSFKEIKITGEGDKLPKELYTNLKEAIFSVDKRLKEIRDFRDGFLEKERDKIVDYINPTEQSMNNCPRY
jgi:vacuolar-type H+-ATPase subunit I/STV1